MRITIDNLDGLGALDYTSAVAVQGPITLQRALNAPSRCTAELVLGLPGFAMPVRHARVVVTSDGGGELFTGYVATEPVRVYAGEAANGSAYRARMTAISDEWLLDKLSSGTTGSSGNALALTANSLVTTLTSRAQAGGPTLLSVASGPATLTTGVVTSRFSAPWSANAGAAAGAAYAGYRALGGQIFLTPAGSTTHAFSDADGTLSIAELQTSAVRELANDVTLSGAEEPAAYICENFIGDGTTSVFELSEPAFRATHRTLVSDDFGEAAISPATWAIVDPGSHLSLTSAGLTLNGGNGFDGQTTVTALDAIEMGGSVIAQLSNVILAASSDGMVAGMYQGAISLANCFAGFRVRQSSGNTIVVPVINGAEVGTVFTPATGHSYTLRLRLHSVEMQRVQQRYYCMVDGTIEGFGSAGGIAAPMDVVFDLIDEGVSSNTPATVLYDTSAATGPLASTPAKCAFVVANSTNLFGSIGSVRVTQPGSLWLISTLPGGSQQTRLIGAAGQGNDCVADYGNGTGANGKITFFAGRAPAVNERISVFYRSTHRAVARLQNAVSVAAEAIGGAAGSSRWLGKVLEPIARSSVDCESAAQAVLAFATNRTAAVAGTYGTINPASDIWPGDVLAITSAGVTSSLLVRSVAVEDGNAVPEVRRYTIKFANDWATEWADGLGMKLSEAIAADAILPQTALNSPGEVLANLQRLAVTSLTTTAITVDAGTAPSSGGGFEVRRKDWEFGIGVDGADLVLRSPVATFSIPRAAQVERYYIRMYDGSTPPLYSRFSSAVFVNAPVS